MPSGVTGGSRSPAPRGDTFKVSEDEDTVKPDDEPGEDNGLTGGASPKPTNPTPPKPQADGAKADSAAEETAEQRLARQYAEYLAAGYGTDANLPDVGEVDREMFTSISKTNGQDESTSSAATTGDVSRRNRKIKPQRSFQNGLNLS